jgi:hypothetical protein
VWSPAPFRRELVKVKTVTKQLPFGDIRMARYPSRVVIERKKNLSELASNLLGPDRFRFGRAWERFITGCRYPVLLIEQSFGQTKLNRYAGKMTVEGTLAKLYELILDPRLLTIWAHSTNLNRKMVGTNLVRLMLSKTIE